MRSMSKADSISPSSTRSDASPLKSTRADAGGSGGSVTLRSPDGVSTSTAPVRDNAAPIFRSVSASRASIDASAAAPRAETSASSFFSRSFKSIPCRSRHKQSQIYDD